MARHLQCPNCTTDMTEQLAKLLRDNAPFVSTKTTYMDMTSEEKIKNLSEMMTKQSELKEDLTIWHVLFMLIVGLFFFYGVLWLASVLIA